MRQAFVYVDNQKAGIIQETEDGEFVFQYLSDYLLKPHALPVSLTLPLQVESFQNKTLFPFFDGLIPEGWLLDLSIHNWKLRSNDRMGLLLTSCHDAIGNVSIKEIEDE